MWSFLKNVLFTALMIAAATMISAVFGALAMLFNAPSTELSAANAAAAMIGSMIVMAGGLLFGMAFCTVTLFMAALSMAPVLGLATWLRLPRPAVDIGGGALMAYACGMMAVDMIDTDKLAAVVTDSGTYSVAVIAVFFGGLLGFLRHLIVVPRCAPGPAPGWVSPA